MANRLYELNYVLRGVNGELAHEFHAVNSFRVGE